MRLNRMKTSIGTGNRKGLRCAETKAIVASPMRQLSTRRVENSKSGKHRKGLFAEISMLIVAAKERVAASVNAELTMLYWSVGNRINKVILWKSARNMENASLRNWLFNSWRNMAKYGMRSIYGELCVLRQYFQTRRLSHR